MVPEDHIRFVHRVLNLFITVLPPSNGITVIGGVYSPGVAMRCPRMGLALDSRAGVVPGAAGFSYPRTN